MEIIEPNPIQYSFDTLGWHIVFAMAIVLILIIAIITYIRYRKNAYRRNAIKVIDDACEYTGAFPVINLELKKVAISKWNRELVASLQSNEWFGFLNSTMKKPYTKTDNFPAFTKSIYDPKGDYSTELLNEFSDFAKRWIKTHKIK
ncbi:MAG: DUF4381 domain-containing protein [Mangrovibacterium sp.]